VSILTIATKDNIRTHPNGTAFRLLDVLASNDMEITNYVVKD
jgi:hypothetical protein